MSRPWSSPAPTGGIPAGSRNCAAEVIADAALADVSISADLHTPEDMVEAVGPAVLAFLTSLHLNGG